MRTNAVDCRPLPLTRRAFLRALGVELACRCHPLVAGFTAVADDLVWLMRWCSCSAAPRFATG